MAKPNLSRTDDESLFGQSVKQGNYTVTYDKNGYATKAVKDGGSSATSTKKTTNANNSAAHKEAYDAAARGDWDAVGNAVNKLSVNGDMKDANSYMQELQDEFKYSADDYYKGKYESVYGEGSWDGGSNGVQNTIDAADQLISSITGGGYGGGSFSYAPPEYEGSKWDSVLDSLAQQLLSMTYEDWTQGDQYKALSDRYGHQGKMSMQDVLGQIASRTGGLASSYATTAAQQQYNAYMSELENAAREMYGLERGDLLENAQLAQKYSQEDYDRYLDAWNQWNTNRNFEYDAWRDSVEDQRYTDAYTDKKLEAQAEMMAAAGDFSGYKALGYTDEQIALLQAAWDAANGGIVQNPGKGGGGSYNNGGVSPADIKKMQEELGVTPDGMWGSETKKAAKAAGWSTDPDKAWAAFGSSGGNEYSYWLGDGTSSSGKTSLNYDEDEGVFTWNGKGYSSIEALNDALNAANLSAEEEEVLKKKLSLYGFEA